MLCLSRTFPRDEAEVSDAEQEVRVLAVDDSHDAANGLTAVLISANYSAQAAYDGQSALVAASNFRPHVVLLRYRHAAHDWIRNGERLRQLEFDGPPLLIAIRRIQMWHRSPQRLMRDLICTSASPARLNIYWRSWNEPFRSVCARATVAAQAVLAKGSP